MTKAEARALKPGDHVTTVLGGRRVVKEVSILKEWVPSAESGIAPYLGIPEIVIYLEDAGGSYLPEHLQIADP